MSAPRRGSAPARSHMAPPSGRPANPPPAPVFATTGVARADAVLATLDQTIAPFREAPPEEQGAAGWVSQVLGGALGVVNAPMMFIDAAASIGVQSVLDFFGLGGLFPAQPVAVIGLGLHIGTPHTHVHPPSTIVPAPPIPLPSFGIGFLAGSATVLVNGVPALRAGDIGLGFTCGSMAPPFEIMTGASGVYFAGARVARIGDITFHCNPMNMSGLAVGLGVAGVVAGAAGAAAQASAGNMAAAGAQAAQAGLDAAAMAVAMLRGKDPAGPFGVGVLLGPPGTVLAGGPPVPNIGALAQGRIYQALGRALRSAARSMRGRTPPPDANGTRSQGGEPVHIVTGEAYNTHEDFVSEFGFRWSRYTTSAAAGNRGVLGWGWRHRFETRLEVRLHRATLIGFTGERIAFPRFRPSEDTVRAHGYVLRRRSPTRFDVSHPRLGTLEFEREAVGATTARVVRVRSEEGWLDLRYDGHRRLAWITERPLALGAAEHRYRLAYDDAGNLAEIWGGARGSPPRRLAHYVHDGAGHLAEAHDPQGAVERFAYDNGHRIRKATDRRGYRFTWEYDHDGRCIRTQGEDGQWFAGFEYVPAKLLTRMTLHDGSVRTYHYDEDGVIVRIVDPYGGELQRFRDPNGRVVAEVDAGGRRVDFKYDADGAHVARVDRFGHRFPPQLDAPGMPDPFARVLPRHPKGRQWGRLGATAAPKRRVDRDARGRVVREIDAAKHEARWRYDGAGNAVAFRDRDGREHRTIVSSWNLAGTRIDPLGNRTGYRYSPHERVIEIVDPLGTASSYDYDAKDRLTGVRRHRRSRETYAYDNGDHLVEKRATDGRTLLAITPHANGLPATIALGDGGSIELDYDARGKVTRATTDAHDVQRRWSRRRKLLEERCDGRSVRIARASERTHRTTVAERFVTLRVVDDDGSYRVIDPSGRARRIELAADGSVSIDHGGGCVELQRYDEDGKLVARKTRRRGGASWAVDYTYTPHGDLVAVADSTRGQRRFEVDAAHRLIGETLPDGTRLTYPKDAAGNLLAMPGVGPVRLGTGNRLQYAGTEEFTYNDRDHVATRGAVRYLYDSLDQLVRVEDGAGEPWTATYDGLGRRVTAGRGERQTTFWWDRDRLAARTDPAGQLRIYVYADEDALVPVGFVDYDAVDSDARSGRSYTVFCDQVGLPQQIEDADGKVVWWADWSAPYGEVFVRPGAEIEYNLRWPGHYLDGELGLHYNRFRDYDPRLGRYLQSDPIGCGGGVNLYAYAPNPLVAVDVLGLSHNDDAMPPRDGSEGGEGRPHAENVGADGERHTIPPSPTAFPELMRGAGRTDTHAERAAAMLRQLQTPEGRREVAAGILRRRGMRRQLPDDVVQAELDGRAARDRAAAEEDGSQHVEWSEGEREQLSEDLQRGQREDYDQRLQEEADGLQLHREEEQSVTVVEHTDESVSVGLSGGTEGTTSQRRAEDASTLARALDETHDDAGYHASSEPVDTSRFSDRVAEGGHRAGQCSEPQAAQGASEYNGEHGTDSAGFQTVWAGDSPPDAYTQGDPPRRTSPTGPTTMCPCVTCSGNGNDGNYDP